MKLKRVIVVFIISAIQLVNLDASDFSTAAESSAPISIDACASESDTNCVESIHATTPLGLKIKAELIAPSKNQWKLPGITFEDGENIFISAISWRQDGQPLCWADTVGCSYHSGSIDLGFFPVSSTVPGKTIHFPHDTTDLQCGTKAQPSLCGMWLNFGIELKWELIFRVSNFHLGMLSGRAKNAEITDLDSGKSISEMHRFLLVGTNYMQDTHIVNQVRSTPPGERQYADAVSDGYIVWMWDSNNDALGRITADCRASHIPGPVPHLMFNTYNIGDPNWDSVDKSLSVTVQSAHMSANNALASGYYEMFFPTNVAKCLWGLSGNSATKAVVSISDAMGTPELATISQNVNDQGFTIIASNFHFSSPTIKVKFQDPKSEETPIPTPSASAKTVEKIKTILCYKGKIVKRIQSSKPTCPSGYKVKK